METPSGQKRARDCATDEGSNSCKKPCEGEGSSSLLGLESGEGNYSLSGSVPDGPCLSSTTEMDDTQALLDEAFSTDVTDRKAALKSLEEELGFSDDSVDCTVSSSAVEDFSSPCLANWGSDIWNVQEFDGEDSNILLAGDATCSSESSPAVSESPSSRNSSVVEEDAAEKTSDKASTVEHAGAVDIGFLCEASDDELGIPPSPFSEREQSCEQEQTSDQLGLGDDSVASLQEAVSWALQKNDSIADSGIEEWMNGNLDFMIEQPVESYGSSLFEVETIL